MISQQRMTKSITVPDQWNIRTAVGRFADTNFQFSYAMTESESLQVALQGSETTDDTVEYTLSVVRVGPEGGRDEYIVLRTNDEDSAMAGTELLLRRLQRTIQRGRISVDSSDNELNTVLNSVSKRFNRPLIDRIFSMFQFLA